MGVGLERERGGGCEARRHHRCPFPLDTRAYHDQVEDLGGVLDLRVVLVFPARREREKKG
jgi:hypothetical protein